MFDLLSSVYPSFYPSIPSSIGWHHSWFKWLPCSYWCERWVKKSVEFSGTMTGRWPNITSRNSTPMILTLSILCVDCSRRFSALLLQWLCHCKPAIELHTFLRRPRSKTSMDVIFNQLEIDLKSTRTICMVINRHLCNAWRKPSDQQWHYSWPALVESLLAGYVSVSVVRCHCLVNL